MNHATDRWSDFVRGITPLSVTTRMQQHLLSGCKRCNRTATILGKLATVASQPDIAVPRAVVHNAQAIFSITRKSNVVSSIVAKIVFDSFLEPLPAGVRSRTRMFRQAMFEAGNVLVDLRLENQADGTFLMTGQVADRSTPTRAMSRVSLHLVNGTERRELQANRFGEFQTVYCADGDIRLEISGVGRNIEVPLSQFNAGAQNESTRDQALPGLRT
jgi:hypothetical protein